MSEGAGAARSLALLSMLHDEHGSQVFGAQMQRMLAHSFRRAGYTVTSNSIGVPDFVASRGLPPTGYAVEAKTGARINLTARELAGITAPAHTPVVAVLLYPDNNPRWIFLDGAAMIAGLHPQRRVRQYPALVLDFNANASFRAILSEFHRVAREGTAALDAAFLDEVRTVAR